MRRQAARWWASLGVTLFVLVCGASYAPAQDEDLNRETWLGVYTQSLTEDLREGIGYRGNGVLINRVVPDSPADRAGLRKGDVIIGVGSRSVDSPDELARVIQSSEAGNNTSIRIVRDGEKETLSVRLAARPEREEVLERIEPETPKAPKVPKADRKIRNHDGDEFELEVPHQGWGWGQGSGQGQGIGRGRLGVRVEDLSPAMNRYFRVDGGKGALVIEVVPDSPADRSGLRAGDVIVQVGESRVDGVESLVEALGAQEGKTSIEIVRDGERSTIDATLEEAKRDVIRIPRGEMRRFQGGDLLRPRSGPEEQELRRELRELREELKQLRRELEELKRG